MTSVEDFQALPRLSMDGHRRLFLVLLLVGGLLMAGTVRIHACGLTWGLPYSHFEGVDEKGYVAYWEKIGELDCGGGLVFPLHINFSSKRDSGAASPYLGQGWLFPLLECRFVQESEDRFVMVQPDGWMNLFLRSHPSSVLLNGSGGWKAEIKDATITASADCGWSLKFNNGHLSTMITPKGRRIDWLYENGRLVELREGSTTKLGVSYDFEGKPNAINLPGRGQIKLVQVRRLKYKAATNPPLPIGVQFSLGLATSVDGKASEYSYGLDDRQQPYLKINKPSISPLGSIQASERIFCWDATTQHVCRVDAWSYEVKPATSTWANADIRREDGQGGKEIWFRDVENGRESVQYSGGPIQTIHRYLGGRLAGRTKKVTESSQGTEKITYRAGYDENGQLIREEWPLAKQTIFYRSVASAGGLRLASKQGEGTSFEVQPVSPTTISVQRTNDTLKFETNLTDKNKFVHIESTQGAAVNIKKNQDGSFTVE